MPENEPVSILRTLRRRDASVGPRIVATLVSALALSGLACIAARMFCAQVTYGSGTRMRVYGRVRDDDIGLALLVAALVWLVAQFWIWGNLERGRWMLRALLSTVAVAFFTILACLGAAYWIRGDEEFVILGLSLVGGAITLMIWATALFNRARGRPVVTPDDL